MPRRTAAEAEETRRQIIAVARHAFASKGYAETSTSEIVAQAGVTRGALYHHFRDKADLFRAVFVEVAHDLNETVIKAAASASDPRKVFRAGCRAALTAMSDAEYHQIAVVDGPAVLGWDEWHRIDRATGQQSMLFGLDTLAQAGLVQVTPTPALVVGLFGALTHLGLAHVQGELSIDEALDAFDTIVDHL
jgi:AcrR family transcriptional regulator